MLRKLLKYDLRAVWSTCWGAFPAMAGCTAVAVIASRALEASSYYSFEMLWIMLLVLSLFGVMASIAAIGITVFTRFFKNLFTDEGYLTFTLPVKRSTLLMSKTLNAFICGAISALSLTVCILVFITFGFEGEKGAIINLQWISSIGQTLRRMWIEYGAWLPVRMIEIVVLAVSSSFLMISAIHFAISMGTTVAKKAKVLATVGFLYLVGLALSMISGSFGFVGIINSVEQFILKVPDRQEVAVYSVILLIACIMTFSVGLILHFMTLDRISRKLNLE